MDTTTNRQYTIAITNADALMGTFRGVVSLDGREIVTVTNVGDGGCNTYRAVFTEGTDDDAAAAAYGQFLRDAIAWGKANGEYDFDLEDQYVEYLLTGADGNGTPAPTAATVADVAHAFDVPVGMVETGTTANLQADTTAVADLIRSTIADYVESAATAANDAVNITVEVDGADPVPVQVGDTMHAMAAHAATLAANEVVDEAVSIGHWTLRGTIDGCTDRSIAAAAAHGSMVIYGAAYKAAVDAYRKNA